MMGQFMPNSPKIIFNPIIKSHPLIAIFIFDPHLILDRLAALMFLSSNFYTMTKM